MSAYRRNYKRSGAALQGTLSNWISHIVSSRVAESEKRKITDRAWSLYNDDAMAHGLLDGYPAEIVNIGITPQAKPMTDYLNRSSDWEMTHQKKVYNSFEIWGLDPRNFCDFTSRQNIYMLQALAVFQWKLEGIALFQIVFDKKTPYRPFNLAILPIDPSRLATPTNAPKGKEIFDGIEIDDNGKPVKIWLKKSSSKPATIDNSISIPITDKKTGFSNILLVGDVKNISEYRQDSALSSIIKEVRDGNDFFDAALVKALVSNLWTIFIEDTYGQAQAINTDWIDRARELEKGTILIGGPGEKPQEIKADAPGPNFQIMFDKITERVGMATNRGGENLRRSYNSSYSASRANKEDTRMFDDYDRSIINNRFNQPILTWLQYEMCLRGMLDGVTTQDFLENAYAYSRCEFLPPPERPIDKTKEANATKTNLETGMTTYSTEYSKKGVDWRAARRQIAIEKQYDQELEQEFGVSMKDESNETKTAQINSPS